ncbi:putative pentatricopeptide repeat-containing protein At2g01510 [Amborella trichopoda]|uniref:putative pentatricopeptide repeat-containing protein At2g01510 n=1 Tax=Amborella trichopoda TaxID=13333 RepID=UPI0009BFF77B|nr:putative pentatricopeptide repeat-containing protein At2g01510 [Amborella trichopoda]|eukprot:XP_011628311.2 putative pentatricopeptide repeat-containing protein At2g01510 [Amborella trichopoda]
MKLFKTNAFHSLYSITTTNVDSYMIKTGFLPSIYKWNHLIKTLIQKGNLLKAQQVFNKMPQRNIISWNSLISGYIKGGDLVEAQKLIDQMKDRNVVTWTVMIASYSSLGDRHMAFELFSDMQKSYVKHDHVTITTLLSACNDKLASSLVIQLHTQIVKHGYGAIFVVSNTLIDSFAKCGLIEYAQRVFDEIPRRDCVSFNALIMGYLKDGILQKALNLFVQMRNLGVKPSEFTFAAILSAVSGMDALGLGMQVHGYVIKANYGWNLFVNNAILDLYVKNEKLIEAKEFFNEMPEFDGVSYNILITGYAWNMQCKECINLYRELLLTNFKKKNYPFASLLSMCANLPNLEMGMEIHAQAIHCSADEDAFVTNALVDMYAKCGDLEDSKRCFRDGIEFSVSWTAMISGYVQRGFHHEALELYAEMRKEDVCSDPPTSSSVLRACASLATIGVGEQVHSYLERSGFLANVHCASALLDMYAKCGFIDQARQVFKEMPNRNVVSWNAMISAYAQNGYGKAAVELFDEMVKWGRKPDSITFLSLLNACNHAGLVREGSNYLKLMTQVYGVEPKREHYACMVDILGRIGWLDEAEELINKMPFESDDIIWSSILNSCRIHGNHALAKRAADHLFKMELSDGAPYVLMSNIYAALGRWEDVAKVKKSMKDRGVRKERAYSWVEIERKTHSFLANDDSHCQIDIIREMLQMLSEHIKMEGYDPDTGYLSHLCE